MKHLIASLALLLAACGGGAADPSEPLAQCKGTPKAAIVYAGEGAFPELAAVADACVFTVAATSVADVQGAMERVRRDSGQPRAYLIASGAAADLALAYMASDPGRTDGASLWLGAFPSTDLHGAIVSVYLNGVGCEALASSLRAHWTPGLCLPAAAFGPAERAKAISQLR